MKGGYIMIDCRGLDITKGSTEQTITGLHNRLKNAIKANKPIYCFNMNVNGGAISPIAFYAYVNEDTVVMTSTAMLQFVVTENDVVTAF